MIAIFDREKEYIVFLEDTHRKRVTTSTWKAANNTDSRSKGPWPPGVYEAHQLIRVTGHKADRDGAYGPWFMAFRPFTDSTTGLRRTGMGIHAGRENDADGRGRTGHQHATMGCIRIEPPGMSLIVGRHLAGDDLEKMWVL